MQPRACRDAPIPNDQLSRLIFRLLDLLRFRSGPQDLPAGWGFALLVILLYVAQAMLADRLLDGEAQAPRSLVSIGIQFVATAALLHFTGFRSRLPQCLSALAATGLVFGAASILMVLQAKPGEAQPLLVLTWLAAFLWSLAVEGHIYRHALSITMSVGMLVAVLIFALNFVLIEALFPATTTGG